MLIPTIIIGYSIRSIFVAVSFFYFVSLRSFHTSVLLPLIIERLKKILILCCHIRLSCVAGRRRKKILVPVFLMLRVWFKYSVAKIDR